MLNAVVRAAARPATIVARSALKQSSVALAPRLLSTSAIRSADHGPAPPQLFGPGAKPGEVPTDENQSTGLERLQILGHMEGIEVFDKNPLDSSRIGTLADPILVPSLDVQRIVGCTGSPADSHDTLWFNLTEEKLRRCPECGSAYKLDFQGDREALAHAHH